MITKKIIADNVYEKIKGRILNGTYLPGTEFSENMLAEEFNVSRTPVREALKRLEQDGVVRIYSRRGAVFEKLSMSDVIEISNIREVLEGLAARLATKYATKQELMDLKMKFPSINDDGILDVSQYDCSFQAGILMHNYILSKTKNNKLVQMIRNLEFQIDLVTRSNAEIPGRYVQAYVEHIKIIDAMLNKDEVLAEQAMKEHLQNVLNSMVQAYKYSL